MGLPDSLQRLVHIARWPVMAVGMVAALSIVYRFGPDRDTGDGSPAIPILAWGPSLATAGWVGASLLLSLYTSRFASFGQTYGPWAGMIVLMLWLYVTNLLVLSGAELDAELERRRVHRFARRGRARIEDGGEREAGEWGTMRPSQP